MDINPRSVINNGTAYPESPWSCHCILPIFRPGEGGGGAQCSHHVMTCHESSRNPGLTIRSSNMCDVNNVQGLSVMANLYISNPAASIWALTVQARGQCEAAAGFYWFSQLYHRVNESWHLSHLESLTLPWQERGDNSEHTQSLEIKITTIYRHLLLFYCFV